MSSVQDQPIRPAAPGDGQDSDVDVAARPREQFVPLRRAELVELLVSQGLNAADVASFRRFCSLLAGLIHRELHATLEDLKNAYAPFDPDPDTHRGDTLDADQLARHEAALFEKFGWLLERGNFTQLKQAEIDRALADRTAWGMNLAVNFEIFERLELYYRGDTLGTRFRRRLANRFRVEAVDVPVYQRLVVIFRLRPQKQLSKYLDTEDVHIKLFKDIPQVDLEMLLPGTNVKMSLFDRVRIMLPTLSGVSMAIWKIVAVASFPLFTSLAFLGLVGGTVGYGVRSLYGYLNTKQKYQLNLTQSLYYQNLDNNSGVIHRLVDEAEEQENREAMLAYFYLWRHAPATGWSAATLDSEIEVFLRASAQREIDFEIRDALEKLERLALVERLPDDMWRPVPMESALAALAGQWARPPA